MNNTVNRKEYLEKAISSIENNYSNGFWKWLDTERKSEGAIISLYEDIIADNINSGMDDEKFIFSVNTWFNRVKINLLEYKKIATKG